MFAIVTSEKSLEVAASMNLPNFKTSPQWWQDGREAGMWEDAEELTPRRKSLLTIRNSFHTSAELPPFKSE